MYKNKILFLFIFSFVFFWGTPVKAQTCTNGTETGACQAGPCDLSIGQSEVSSPSPACPGASICCSGGGGAIPSPSPAGGLQYTLLEKIPGFASTDGSDLPKYILALYNLALAIVVLSAVFMVSIGGFMYLTSAGNTSAMGTAKGVIFDALIGLVIALTAWLLLNVINPDLTNVSINGLSALPVSPGAVGGAVLPPAATGDTYTDTEARDKLLHNSPSIGVNVPKPITSLDGIPKSTIDYIIALQNAVGSACAVVVSGGTESGHVSHGAGLPVVDVRNPSCLKTFLANKGNLSGVHITKICAIASEQEVAYNCSYKEPAAHFHLVFTP